MPRFVKGSQEAKQHMARLRGMRRGGGLVQTLGLGKPRFAPPRGQRKPRVRPGAGRVQSRGVPRGFQPGPTGVGAGFAGDVFGGTRQAASGVLDIAEGVGRVAQGAAGGVRAGARKSAQLLASAASHFRNLKAHAKSVLRGGNFPPHHKKHLQRIAGHRGHKQAARDFAGQPRGGAFWDVLKGLFKSAPAPTDTFRQFVTDFGKFSAPITAQILPGFGSGGGLATGGALRSGGSFPGKDILDSSGRVIGQTKKLGTRPGTRPGARPPGRGRARGGALRSGGGVASGGSVAEHFRNLKKHAKDRMKHARPRMLPHLQRIVGHRGHIQAIRDFAGEPRGGGLWNSLGSLFESSPGPVALFKQAAEGLSDRTQHRRGAGGALRLLHGPPVRVL